MFLKIASKREAHAAKQEDLAAKGKQKETEAVDISSHDEEDFSQPLVAEHVSSIIGCFLTLRDTVAVLVGYNNLKQY